MPWTDVWLPQGRPLGDHGEGVSVRGPQGWGCQDRAAILWESGVGVVRWVPR